MDGNYKKKKGLDWYKKRKKKAELKRTGDIKKEKWALDENGNGHKPKKKSM